MQSFAELLCQEHDLLFDELLHIHEIEMRQYKEKAWMGAIFSSQIGYHQTALA